MRSLLLTLIAVGLMTLTGCSETPESLGRDFISAMKAKDETKMKQIGEKVAKMSAADQEAFGKIIATEMFGEMMKGMGDMKAGGGLFNPANFGK